MANITAQMVKELRELTGAGMMDCKAALTETGGDMQAAVDWLRKKGLSKAAKKSGRVAAEGLIAAQVSHGRGVVVEVNSETDFVARNDNSLGLESTGRKLMKELLVASLNGLICSSLVFAYNLITNDTFALTITVSVSLMVVIVFASLFGTFLPLTLNRLKIDPALATGPFITTTNDVLGLFIYFGIGKYLFSVL